MPREEVGASGISEIRCNLGVIPSARARRRGITQELSSHTLSLLQAPLPCVAQLGDDRVDPAFQDRVRDPFHARWAQGRASSCGCTPHGRVSVLTVTPALVASAGHRPQDWLRARPCRQGQATGRARGAACCAPRGPMGTAARRRKRGKWPPAPHLFPPDSRRPEVTPAQGTCPSRALPLYPDGQGLAERPGVGRRVRRASAPVPVPAPPPWPGFPGPHPPATLCPSPWRSPAKGPRCQGVVPLRHQGSREARPAPGLGLLAGLLLAGGGSGGSLWSSGLCSQHRGPLPCGSRGAGCGCGVQWAPLPEPPSSPGSPGPHCARTAGVPRQTLSREGVTRPLPRAQDSSASACIWPSPHPSFLDGCEPAQGSCV